MKYCKDCQFSKKEFIQTPQGHGSVLVCTHEECREPVEGKMLPCHTTRTEELFCGMGAKYFVLRPLEITPQLEEKKSLIEVAK